MKSVVRGRLIQDRSGVAAIEFALVFPVFIVIVLTLIVFGQIMWTLNGLQAAGYQTARCVAIGNSACTTPTTYAINLATSYGVPGLTASEVVVTSGSACNQATANTYVMVTITFPSYLSIPLYGSLQSILSLAAPSLVTVACYPTSGN
jgi:Flp pilus assembly protein TadG